MVNGIREFLSTPKGKAVSTVAAVLLITVAGWTMVPYFREDPAAADAATRWFIDTEDGKPFRARMYVGDTIPVVAPSGGKTGYPAELCAWTTDGQIKADPTPVLLNQSVGKPGPTFCPDCGRLVISHNPVYPVGMTPAPQAAANKGRIRAKASS